MKVSSLTITKVAVMALVVAACLIAASLSGKESSTLTRNLRHGRNLQVRPSYSDYAQFLQDALKQTTITTTPGGGQSVRAPPGSLVNQVNGPILSGTIVTGPQGIAAVNSITGGPLTISAASRTGGISVNILEGDISQVSLLNDGNIGAASINIQEGATFDTFLDRGGGAPRFSTFDGSGNLGIIGSVTTGGLQSATSLIIP